MVWGGRGIGVVLSPARVWVEWFVGDRWPGGLGFLGGSLNPGLPPGATVFRPPAADFPTMSRVGLDFRRSVVFNARLSLMQPFCKIPSFVRLRRYPRLRFVLRTR